MFNSGEFSKILDEIFEKDDKEKEKAIETYCKIWKYLENITLQNLKYKRAFEILKKMNGINRTLFISSICDVATYEEIELIEELMNE